MRRHHSLLPLCAAGLAALAACADPIESPVEPTTRPSLSVSGGDGIQPVPGRYVVMFREEQVDAGFAATVRRLGGTIETSYDDMGIAVVTGIDDARASELRRGRGVAEVQQDLAFPIETPQFISDAEGASEGMPASPDAPGTAFFFARQWHLRAIGADQAWAAGRLGSPAVTVAILDTGIDDRHPDLAGLVDAGRSRSLLDPTYYANDDLYRGLIGGSRPAYTDMQYHGTHVAATVASNASAAAGVTSKTTLVAVKVCGINPNLAVNCLTSGVLAGMRYAADIGADVANMSLGGSFSKAAGRGFHSIINRTTNYVARQGTLLVVSAGNAATDLDRDGDSFKSYCSAANVVCVSATGPTARASVNGPWTNIDALSSYSNFGRSSITVAAPGGNGASSVTAACSTASVYVPVCQTGVFVIGLNGTSMAAPHVTGLAALLAEEYRGNPSQIRAALQQGADDLGQPGTDPSYGKGRINVPNSLGL